MKWFKVLLAVSVIGLILSGCSEEEKQIRKLLSDKENTYSLLIVGDERDVSEMQEQEVGNKTVNSIYNSSSLKSAQKEFPSLKINRIPTYVIFNDKEEVFRTNDYKKLVDFLQ